MNRAPSRRSAGRSRHPGSSKDRRRGRPGKAVPASRKADAGKVDGPLTALLAAAAKGPSVFGKGLIRVYRYTLSSIMGRECRHLPTCSEYGEDAIDRHGLWAGGWMTLARVARCHPWGTSGLDFVPEEKPNGARWYLPWLYGRWRGVNEHAGGARRGRRRVRAL